MAETNPLVLVVDDNEMNRDMLARRLQRQNCDVVMAEDGAAALEAVTRQSFDLILLDIMMPNVSGYEVLEKLKADPNTRHIPVIMISAVDDLDSVVRCIEMGAEDYLFKPFNPVLLKARVTSSLGRRQAGGSGVASHLDALRTALSVWEQEAATEASRAALGNARTHLEALARLAQ